MSRRLGVTLLELLIAISLLSLLSVAILMALRLGLNATGKANAKAIANRRVTSVERILQSEIEGLIPLTAACRPDPKAPPQRVWFFEGQTQSMRFVSSYSLQEAGRGYPRILEFQVIPGENNRGVRLVVNEQLYTGPESTGALCLGFVRDPMGGGLTALYAPITTGPQSFVLADKLSYCRFGYLRAAPAKMPDFWVPQWNLTLYPRAVRVDMAPLDADASRVPLVSVFAPVRSSREASGG
jgi:prepilin-type N-terminal cleavage/methylation domain-containing protein